jgi:hypothetical protein
LADVRFGAHYGLKSDIARGPKLPKSGSEPARNHLYDENDIVQSLLDEVFFDLS